jgi:Na+/phosphate symporter
MSRLFLFQYQGKLRHHAHTLGSFLGFIFIFVFIFLFYIFVKKIIKSN